MGDSADRATEPPTSDAGEMDLGIEVSKGLVAKLVQAVLGFAGTIVFANILGPVGFGGFYLLLSVVDIVDKPVVGGWASASKKRFSEGDFPREAVVGAQTLFNLGMLAVVAAGAYAARGWLASYTGLDYAAPLLLVLFAPIVFFYPFQNMVAAKGLVGRQVWTDTFRSVLTLPLQLAFVLLEFGAAGMALGLGGATALTLPVTYYTLATRPAIPGPAEVRSLWAFARHSIPKSMVSKVFDRYDSLLLGLLLGPAAVGDYQVALKLTVPAMFVATIAGSALMPKVSNLRSQGEAVVDDVTNTLAFASVLAIPIFFGALAIPRPLVVTLYSGQYADATTLLVGLAAFRVVRTQSNPLQRAIDGLDRPDVNLKISGTTLALNVVAGYALVTVVGAVGVVVATLGAEVLRYALASTVVRGELPGVDLLPRPVVEQAAAGLVMFAVVYGAAQAVSIRSWPYLVVVVGVGAAVYGAVLFAVSSQVRGLATKLFDAAVAQVPWLESQLS